MPDDCFELHECLIYLYIYMIIYIYIYIHIYVMYIMIYTKICKLRLVGKYKTIWISNTLNEFYSDEEFFTKYTSTFVFVSCSFFDLIF